MPALENDRHERFCREYLVDFNGAQAAIRARFAESGARVQASRLLSKPNIQARISELQKELEAKLELNTVEIAQRWATIATADPNELTSIVYGACRYCHGKKHEYQWRTKREYDAALIEWLKATPGEKAQKHLHDVHRKEQPNRNGGFGYDDRAEPNPKCPECHGRGVANTVFHDTRNLSPAGRALFAGVKETRNGIEVKMHDQGAALEKLARHLGMFSDDDANQAVTDLAAAIGQINQRGSSAPIASAEAHQDEGEDD